MKNSEKLDLLLKTIAKNKDFISSKMLFEDVKGEIIPEELTPIVNKLFLDNNIEKKILENISNSKLSPPYFCRITFSGLLFLERGGYCGEDILIKKNKIWTKTKTFANRLNTIIILIIALLGVYVSWDSKHKDEKIEKNQKTIDSLKTILIDKSMIDKNMPNLNK
ncbi:hypothetical protein [Flavobacterium sp. FlaQc-28]|uniref:hypothetical protein n=1 Tax=Flavobacterium sp. FlaQc-28 TaxID=3374178 RepID=UPI003757558C